jgi:hypothetical protein
MIMWNKAASPARRIVDSAAEFLICEVRAEWYRTVAENPKTRASASKASGCFIEEPNGVEAGTGKERSRETAGRRN